MIENSIAQKNIDTKWRFWFSALLSIFLVITFVYYLPLRFRWGFLHHDGAEMMMGGIMHGGNKEGHNEEHDETIYHETGGVADGIAVSMEVLPIIPDPFRAATLNFFVNVEEAGVLRPIQNVQELEKDHGKLMHVIGVRSDLNNFFHIHPEPPDPVSVYGAPGIFQSAHVFGAPGRYKIWSEIKRNGTTHIFQQSDIYAGGAGETENKNISFSREVSLGKYKVVLQPQEPVVAGRMSEFDFRILTSGGMPVSLEDYLETPMHLVIIKDDLTRLIHAHPESGHSHSSFLPKAFAHGMEDEAMDGIMEGMMKEDGELHFSVVFPEAGLYKLFGQFRPAGEGLKNDDALLASFWVNVEEEGEQPNLLGGKSTVPSKVFYALISGILMIGLSLRVRRFLKST